MWARRYDRRMRDVFLTLVLVAAAGCSSSNQVASPSAEDDAGEPEVAPDAPLAPAMTKIGPILDPKGTSFGRDGCGSGPLGGKILYTFGDTLFYKTSVDGRSYASNTAAFAELTAPTVLTEPLDANGLPSQFVPFTAEEQAYNDATKQGNDRYVIWPGRVIERADHTGVVFFNELRIHPTGPWEGIGTGVAIVKDGETTATRASDLLFHSPEGDFTHAAFLQDGTVYVYACDIGLCRVAKAPLAGATERASYTFWTGNAWSPNYADATAPVPGSGAGFSVSYNAYLGQYLSFTSSGIGTAITMRVAPHPWGPWSAGTTIYTFPAGNVYAAGEHPALDSADGKRVYVSAFNDLGSSDSAIVLFSVDLVKPH